MHASIGAFRLTTLFFVAYQARISAQLAVALCGITL
jgi:hypothetical protein